MRTISATLVTAENLAEFARSEKAAEELLPIILRKLVLDRTDSLREIKFLTNKSTNDPGWDVVVDCVGAEYPVPEGLSGWEITARKDHKTKADEDFDTRTVEIPGGEQAKTTYVHWTIRKWRDRRKWAKAKKEEGKGQWLDVLAFDAADLETWLIQHLPVHLWLSRLLGRQPLGVMDIVSFWDDWSKTPVPALVPGILTHGYESQQLGLVNALKNRNQVLSLQWEKPEFAVAFVAATLADSVDDEVEKLAARCVYVKTEEAFDQLVSEHRDLILVPKFVPSELGLARLRGHTVVIALGRDAAQGGDIVLKARTHAELVEAMAPWEPNEDKRRLLADKAATQFASFYRAVVPRASIQTPTWAALENVPYLLLGSWDSAYQGDLDAIREISGRDFGPENNRAIDLAKAPEALVHQLGSTISIVRLEDAWDFLGIHATDDQLDAFLRVVKSVFGEVDPQYSIEDPDEAANIGMISNRLGRLKHSMLLRQGLAANLCYLGSMGDTVNGTGKRNGSVVARQAVRALFEEETSWQSFCSLAPWFALFAEASPDDFLTAIERDLKNNPDKIRALFRDGEANKNFFLTHSSPHTFLLWAIETCAWSPHFLTRAALVLARVSKIDPGGSLSNRPKASLRDIFLTWSPKTNASLDYRLAALKMVGSVDGDLYWELLKEILPTGHSIAMGKSGARFRPWGPLWQPPMTHGELRRAVEEVYTLMIDSAGTVGSRWATLLDFIAIMPSGVEQVLLQALGDMATGGLSGEARVQVRECLRQTIARHRSHPDAPWVMPEERLDTLQRLLELYKPADVIEAWRWVFSDHAVFELGPGTDFQAKNLELERLQREAVEVIYRDLGLDGLLLLALGNKSPWKLGVAFAEVGMNLDLATTVQIACEASPDGANFALGFVGKSTELRGPSVVWDLITSVWGHSLDPHSRMMFLRCLPLNLETLDKLKDLDRETQSRYWNGLGTYSLVRSGEDVVEAVLRNLIEFEAYTNAVAVIAPLVHGPGPKISPGRALQILEDATASNSVDWHRLGHDVAEILDYLDRFPEIDSIRVARLEFTFASFLSLTRNPRRLNRLIAEDPATFILLLRAAYKPRDKTIVEEEDADSLPPPMLAYEVLKSLRTLPGDRGDGSIDSATMRAWIDTGLPLARSANRLEAFESSAGDWFAKSPRGTDGFFPHESVRQVFQHLESEDFERGFEIGVRNERGMVTKQQSEGGDQERRLAESYKRDADALELRWHRAALTMRRISDDYFAEAKQEDRRVRRE